MLSVYWDKVEDSLTGRVQSLLSRCKLTPGAHPEIPSHKLIYLSFLHNELTDYLPSLYIMYIEIVCSKYLLYKIYTILFLCCFQYFLVCQLAEYMKRGENSAVCHLYFFTSHCVIFTLHEGRVSEPDISHCTMTGNQPSHRPPDPGGKKLLLATNPSPRPPLDNSEHSLPCGLPTTFAVVSLSCARILS